VILADTGVFISAADRSEPSHQVCAELLRSEDNLVVPAPVIPEAAWLIEDRLGPQAEARFLRFVTSGLVQIVDLGADDYARCIELILGYEDLGLGLVDASIIALGERLSISHIATLNRRDFLVVRPRHTDAFELLP